MRKAGEIVWRSAGEAAQLAGGQLAEDHPLAGVRLGLRHVGIVEAQRHMRKLRRLRLDELRRIKAEQAQLLAAGGTAKDAPELFPGTPILDDEGKPVLDDEGKPVRSTELTQGDVRTPEGEDQLAAIMREIVGGVVAGHEGLDLPADAEPPAIVDELDRLGLTELYMGAALEVQSPEPQFRPADERPRGREDTDPVGR